MSYKELIVWQKAMMLVEAVYRHMRSFPADERFRLCDQLSRAVVSIPSNIAEGYGRGAPLEYARYLGIARGSLYEVETQLEIAALAFSRFTMTLLLDANVFAILFQTMKASIGKYPRKICT